MSGNQRGMRSSKNTKSKTNSEQSADFTKNANDDELPDNITETEKPDQSQDETGGSDTDSQDEREHDENKTPDDLSMILKYLKTLDDKMEKIDQRLKSIDEKVTEIESLTSRMDNLEVKIDETSTQLGKEKVKVNKLQQKYDELLEKHLSLDSYNRRENLLFHGITSTPDENCTLKVKELLTNTMQISGESVDIMRFQRCHRLGKGEKSPIICRFAFYEDRDLVWGKRNSLKKSQYFITENFPPEIEDRRKKLYPVLKAAKKQNKKAKIVYDKLIIESKEYSVMSLHTLPQQLVSAAQGTETKNNVTCFFTSASPLSNFHVIEDGFLIGNQKFDCVERYFQLSKAIFAEKPSEIHKIKVARSAAQCKAIGDSIKVDDQAWLPVAKKEMFKACRAKFYEHPASKEFLINTGDTDLAEASPNVTWGIGIKMDNPDAFKKNKWLGQNFLGDILQKIRNDLKNI